MTAEPLTGRGSAPPADALHVAGYRGFRFYLTLEGKFFICWRNGPYVERPWFTAAGRPWLVKRPRNFRALVAQEIRDGEYDDLQTPAPARPS